MPTVPDLEKKVLLANDYVEKEFQALTAVRYKMKDTVARATRDWDHYSKPLEQSCTATHDALLKLAKNTQSCEDAQNSRLANLFEQRSKQPESMKSRIKGCAKAKNHSFPEEDVDCKCGERPGGEHDGCRDAQITTDHTLLCTQLRQRVLPHMALWRLTAPGGACYIDGKNSINRAMLAEGAPENFEFPQTVTNAMPSLLLALPQLPHWQSADRRAYRDREAASRRAHYFL